MLKIWNCRRSSLALIGMILLTALGVYLKVDTSGAIAMVVLSVAAANAGQAVGEKITSKPPKQD